MISTQNPVLLRPGLVSITLRQLAPSQIIALCTATHLEGIEWGGDVHVPPGDLHNARTVRRQTKESGLHIAAYGSYYRVGHSEAEMPFDRVLETAVALGAPLIRVWAGTQDAEDADEKYFYHIVEESRRMGDLAAEADVTLAYEFHGRTLNNSAAASKVLFEAIAHPPWQTLWQPLAQETLPQAESLRLVLPHLANLHVYHWQDYNNRFALADGRAQWEKYFCVARGGYDVEERWALLEFVRGDDPAALREDAAVLHRLLT